MLFALQACGEDPTLAPSPGAIDQESPSPSPAGTALGQDCFSPRDGYRVEYPEGWHVNDPEGANPCAWFHPEPFTLPVATEVTGIAIRISLAEQAYEQISESITTGPHVGEVLSSEELSLQGDRQALRAETVESGEGLLDRGVRQTIYAIEWDQGTLTASTTDVAAGDYAANVEVLDQMVQTLQPYESEATCSAAALDPDLPEQEGLPEAVAAMRADIAEAAVACDYERLGQLAQQGDAQFTYSFGNGGDPAEYWRNQETDERTPGPMRYLAALLKRPYETREEQGEVNYVWPAAFAYDSWDAVPEEQKEALEPLYSEMNFRDFERFGGYTGYRIGIDENGNWLFFVAGD